MCRIILNGIENISFSDAGDSVGLVGKEEFNDEQVSNVFRYSLQWLEECVKKVQETTPSDIYVSQEISCLGIALHYIFSLMTEEHLQDGELFFGHCRETSLILLSKDINKQPSAVLLGLEILIALVSLSSSRVSAGFGSGYWVVAQVIDKLDTILLSLRTTSRLVSSQTFRSNFYVQICRFFNQILVVVQNRRLNGIAEEYIDMALTCLDVIKLNDQCGENASLSSFLSNVVIETLARLWSNCQIENKMFLQFNGLEYGKEFCEKSDESSTATERSWNESYHSDLDLKGLKHCFQVLFLHVTWKANFPEQKGCQSSLFFPDDVNIAAIVEAIDKCLQKQIMKGGRHAGVVILKSCGIYLSSPARDSKTTFSECFDDSFILRVVRNPHFDTQIRVVLAKVLDVLYTSESLLTNNMCSLSSEALEDDEKDEFQSGELMCRQLLGDCLFSMYKDCTESLPNKGDVGNDDMTLRCNNDFCTVGSGCEILDGIALPLHTCFATRSLLLSGSEPMRMAIDNSGSSLGSEQCSDSIGTLLLHLLILQKIDTICTSSSQTWAHKRAVIGLYLSQSGVIEPVLRLLIRTQDVMPMPSDSENFVRMFGDLDPALFHPSCADMDISLGKLFAYSLYRSTCLLPVATRTYWNEHCNRSQRLQLEKFIQTNINKNIVRREIAIVKMAEQQGRVKAANYNASLADMDGQDDGTITIRCSAVTQEFVTTFTADEVSVEMTIRLPVLYPLRNVSTTQRCQYFVLLLSL